VTHLTTVVTIFGKHDVYLAEISWCVYVIELIHNFKKNKNTRLYWVLVIAHAQNGRIYTSGVKSDVTIVLLEPDFL